MLIFLGDTSIMLDPFLMAVLDDSRLLLFTNGCMDLNLFFDIMKYYTP